MKGLKPGKVLVMDFIFQLVFNDFVLGVVNNVIAFFLGLLGLGS